MLRRVAAVFAALGLLNLSGCAVFQILALPLQLLMSVFGLVGDGFGALVDTVAVVEPLEGPAPAVRMVEPGQWAFDGLDAASRFRVTVSSPGHVPRQYLWPDDFPQSVQAGAGTIHVTAHLSPIASAAE